MSVKHSYQWTYILLVALYFPVTLFAQQTKINGKVIDAETKLPLAYVSVTFFKSTVGTSTDSRGNFSLKADNAFTQVKISYSGYATFYAPVIPGKTQTINVELISNTRKLNEVIIRSAKRGKYRNKDNPAVELIRQVIAHKEQNRPENNAYVQYKEYDKLQLSLANLSPALSDKKFFRKYKFFLDNRDTTMVPGKSLLPIYLDEKLTQVYYRKNPKKKKNIVLAQKNINLANYIDNEGIAKYYKHLLYDVDIYSNDVYLLSKLFLSPIAGTAPTFYKFFITDTITVNNSKVIELSFTPRNSSDLLFEGKIYITMDGNYAVQKAIIYINKNININFVRSMNVSLDFEQNTNGRYHLSKSNILVDFGLNQNGKGGAIGNRTITIKDYLGDKALPDSTYAGQEAVIADNANKRTDDYWAQNRLDTLTTAEAKVYHNIDTLQTIPSYKRTIALVTFVIAGYKSFGPFELGPANTFYSFNPIEGLKLRVGGRTTPELSKRYYFETYAAYGFKDERWKYFLSGTYSFNSNSIYKFPQNYIRGSFERDTRIPGDPLQFVVENNFLLSFKRGNNDKYLYNDFYKLDYVKEFQSHFSYTLGFRNLTQSPAGSLSFINHVGGVNVNHSSLTSTEATVGLRYAPHEEFYQDRIYRIPIPNKYPVLALDFTEGIKDAFGGEYNYQTLHARLDKHLYLSQLGYADVSLEGGHIFGKLPYPLLTIHRANQTYSFDPDAYNLMNFLEFVSDHYESFNYTQHFNGFFLNKIPLFKRLKWRETASFKALYGGVSNQTAPWLIPVPN
ncbi:DUF5686 and carboxypeptidase-like regulatory domain-containing protein [Mucilaginibacter polytrichastri]|uniref:Uncharacterized protein n=1 Tax=Mucilaginibacter polytrichastri TaxID=1302689 RepID=A0A1Q6A270_9SPHI|nr:DUF5686 and carboxypeptidase-like regulatory domain-containing protein [Mucilaginibacter polytrichastri]OKS88081.1 hypothetical protein RG47T_3545 [Mucilaginibacter polytrichastri]SFT09924.1 CarboxypepD_reg-like domain-containing protein [Mucilaginibacter polytrichastri]